MRLVDNLWTGKVTLKSIIHWKFICLMLLQYNFYPALEWNHYTFIRVCILITFWTQPSNAIHHYIIYLSVPQHTPKIQPDISRSSTIIRSHCIESKWEKVQTENVQDIVGKKRLSSFRKTNSNVHDSLTELCRLQNDWTITYSQICLWSLYR